VIECIAIDTVVSVDEDESDSEQGVELPFYRCAECLKEWAFMGDDKKPSYCPCCGAAHDFHPARARKEAAEAPGG
jgi:hypothetical protein